METNSKKKPQVFHGRSNVRSKTYMPGSKFVPKISYKFRDFQNKEFNDYMEDLGVITTEIGGRKNRNLFCIFDGHGGIESAQICADNFPKFFQKFLKENPINIEYCFKMTYKKVDEKTQAKNIIESGNTATTVYIDDNMLYCANVGDSKCVLVKKESIDKLSYDDKITDEEELKRIKSEGGQIIDERLGGILAISRSFGDNDLKKCGLTSTPHFAKRVLTEKDRFCIVASDGVWDVITDEILLQLSKDAKDPDSLAKTLIDESVKLGSTDNISCIVVAFF